MHPPADRIEVRGLRVFGHHGVLAAERREGQPFVVDATLELDLDGPARSDELSDTIDYARLAEQLAQAVAGTQFRLLEALAGHLAALAVQDPRVAAATIRVAKPQASVAVDLDEVAVVVRRRRP